jgi:hypothetical protein
MKIKIISAISFVVLSLASLQAQTTGEKSVPITGTSALESSTNVEEYVPKAGTVALGASANIVNIFTNSVDAVKVPTLYLQLYLGGKTAIRGTFGIDYINNLDKFYVRDDAAYVLDPLSNILVVDTKGVNSRSYNSSLALQQYFGNSKLRGFIGLQAIYCAGSSNTINTYANPMNAINPLPSSFDGAYLGSQRALVENVSSTYNVGGGVIAGFEYFVFPHLSIGGEMSLNALYSHEGQANMKSETVVNGEVVTVYQAVSPGSTNLEIKSLGFVSQDMKKQIGIYILYHF